MKLLILSLSVVSIFVGVDVRAQQMQAIRVMTFNIRYGTAPDGENSWPLRKSLVLETIRNFQPHVLGLQEALQGQIDEILQAIPQYMSVGVGREADGGGEYSVLLYDRERFDLLAANTFWLSDKPAKRGSHTWGNQLPRICTWARLVDRASGKSFRVFNTHWDHQSQPSRARSGELLSERVSKFAGKEPLILMGDFNAGPQNPAVQSLVRGGLRDSYFALHSGQQNVGTFNAFQGTTSGEKIDAIFINDRWRVLAAEIIHTEREGRYPSDHFPVTATLEVNSKH